MGIIDCVVIPARGGSKRIPYKNMQPFCGMPMLERSIQLAREVSDCVLVSSDDSKILEFARERGAYPLLRDSHLSDDMTPTLPVVKHALLPFLDDEAGRFVAEYAGDNALDDVLTCQNHNLANIPLKITLHSHILCLYATAMFTTCDILIETT